MSRKNNIFRAWQHQNPEGSVKDAWDAAWKAQGNKAYSLKIQALEAALTEERADFASLQNSSEATDRELAELQLKYEALVDGIKSAQSHTSETLRLLQWDQLGWDVPEEVIESLERADSELCTLLEDNDE